MAADDRDPRPGADPAGAVAPGGAGGSGVAPDEPLELAELLNAALDKGVVAHGDVTIAVADVDLVRLNIGLLLSALETAERHASGGGAGGGGAGAGAGARPASLAATFGSILPERAAPAPVSIGSVPGAAAVRVPAVGHAHAGADLARVAPGLPARIDAAAPGVESGLARLVLTLIEVLRKVLEHQAVRRMEGGRLRDDEIERLGLALASLHDRMQDLKRVFGLSDEDLEIDLGPLGRLR